MNRKVIPAEIQHAVCEKYVSGISVKDISTELSISPGAIYNALKKQKITLRKDGIVVYATVVCPHCGAAINPSNAKFCCMCGKSLDKKEVYKSACSKLLRYAKYLPDTQRSLFSGEVQSLLNLLDKADTL